MSHLQPTCLYSLYLENALLLTSMPAAAAEDALLHAPMQASTFHAALTRLQPKNPTLVAVKKLQETEYDHYLALLHIVQNNGERYPLSLSAAHPIHTYIFKELAQVASSKVLPSHETRLARDLYYDSKKQLVGIIAEAALSSIQGGVSIKVVRSAMPVLIKQPAAYFTPLVYTAPALPEYKPVCLEELGFLTQLAKAKNIVRLLSSIQDTAQALLEGFDHDFSHAIQNPQLYTRLQRLQMAEGALTGLAEIHKLKRLHGDLKEPNIVFRITITGAVECALIDLNLTRRACAADGFYACAWYTAPEILGKPRAYLSDEEEQKIEVFALGCILFRLFAHDKGFPLWIPPIDQMHKNRQSPLLIQWRKDAIDSLELQVENPQKKLREEYKTRKWTMDEEILFLIYWMLEVDPKNRNVASQYLHSFSKLREQEEKAVADATTATASAAAPPTVGATASAAAAAGAGPAPGVTDKFAKLSVAEHD